MKNKEIVENTIRDQFIHQMVLLMFSEYLIKTGIMPQIIINRLADSIKKKNPIDLIDVNEEGATQYEDVTNEVSEMTDEIKKSYTQAITEMIKLLK